MRDGSDETGDLGSLMAEGDSANEPVWQTFRDSELDEIIPTTTWPSDWEASTVEELLDEGDSLLQEFRSGNPKLVERLCNRESVRSLVEHATRLVECESEERMRHRSHTAAELLAFCGPGSAEDDSWKLKVIHVFFDTDAHGTTDLMDVLWGFLLDVPPDSAEPLSPSWSVLAGYFCGVMAAVWHKCPGKVMDYLRTRGQEHVFNTFLRFLDTRCVAELFMALICVHHPDVRLFPVDGLMLRLVQRFSSGEGEADENLALVLKTLLVQACNNRIFFAEDVVQQTSSPQVVHTLVDKVLSRGPAPAASVLSMAIAIFFHLSPNPWLPPRGPNLLRPLEEEEHLAHDDGRLPRLDEAGCELVHALLEHLPKFCNVLFGPHVDKGNGEPAPPRRSLEASRLRQATIAVLEAKDGDLQGEAIWDHLLEMSPDPRLLEVLQAFREKSCAEKPSEAWIKAQLLSELRHARAKLDERATFDKLLTPPGETPLSGQLAAEATFVLVELVRVSNTNVLKIFLEQEVLPRALHHLFVRPWGATMLNAVGALVLEIIRSPQSVCIQAVRDFLAGGGLHAIASALRHAADFREAARHQTHRDQSAPELTGLLRRICAELREAGSMWPEVEEGLNSWPCWADVVLPDLEEFSQLEQEPLGGFPKTDSVYPGISANNFDVEFTPEDLRDLDEDMDVELGCPFLLDLGERQMHRQAQIAARKEEDADGSSANLTEAQELAAPPSTAGPLPPDARPGEWV
ncbi:unnamed protein product [Effrenium voratum]|uniref:Uncharacterized protein n=1 Tax=Effrenium voratum TaxID=2562239 RepID=A0AA36J060_9DINO|nr:unnamed protein product [Effrenium voratum]CAJ1424130.1 unnamed protein product [Effrenium voratum]CAJ1434655.1 unnamed protein product [Effrenium voratum]